MFNWSVDTKRLEKNSKKYTIWKLEQSINFGLGDEKLSLKEVKKYYNKLNIDVSKRTYLNFVLYGKKPSFH